MSEVRGYFEMASAPRSVGVAAPSHVGMGNGLPQEDLEPEEFDAFLHSNVLDTLADL